MWQDAGRGWAGPIGAGSRGSGPGPERLRELRELREQADACPNEAGLARLNPARWSQLLPIVSGLIGLDRAWSLPTGTEDRVIDDLCKFLGTGSEERPVRLDPRSQVGLYLVGCGGWKVSGRPNVFLTFRQIPTVRMRGVPIRSLSSLLQLLSLHPVPWKRRKWKLKVGGGRSKCRT